MISNRVLKLPRVLLLIGSSVALILTNTTYALTFSDDFESADLTRSMNGFRFGGTAGTYKPVVSSNNPKNGKYSVKFTFKGEPDVTTGTGSKLQYDFDQYHKDVWVQYDVFFPNNWAPRDTDARAHNKGPIMLWSDNYNDAYLGSYESWNTGNWPTGAVSYHWGGSYQFVEKPYFLYPDPNKDLGRWMNIIVRIKFSDTKDSSNGIYQIWKDGVLGLDKQGKNNYLKNGKGGVNHLYIFGPADTGFNEDTSIYIDNLVISTDPITHSGTNPPNPPLIQP